MAAAGGGAGAAAAARQLAALCLCAVACFHLVNGGEAGAQWTLEKVGHVCVFHALLASPPGASGRQESAAGQRYPHPPGNLAQPPACDPASGANVDFGRGAGPGRGERR